MFKFLVNAAANKTGRTPVSASTTTTVVVSTTVNQNIGLQGSTWEPTDVNHENFYIDITNYLSFNSPLFETNTYTHTSLRNMGHINPETKCPRDQISASPNEQFFIGPYFSSPSDLNFSTHVHRPGKYFCRYEGDVSVTFGFANQGADYTVLSAASAGNSFRGKIEITKFNTSSNRSFLSPQVKLRSANASLASIAIYHENDEADYDAGFITTSVWRNYVSRHKMYRTMDLRGSINNIQTTSIGNNTHPRAQYALGQGNYKKQAFPSYPTAGQWTDISESNGVPNFVPLKIAMETSTILWDHVPIWIDSPFTVDSSVFINEYVSVNNQSRAIWNVVSDLASVNWQTIADGTNYEAFMQDYVARMNDVGYPINRPLIITTSNEIWNFSLAFVMQTNFAAGLGRGYRNNFPGSPISGFNEDRMGYGIQLAKMMIAMETALVNGGRSGQNIVYNCESQTANPFGTPSTLGTMKHYVSTYRGLNWDDYKDKVKWNGATYWGSGLLLYYVQQSVFDANGAVFNTSMHQAMRNKYDSLLSTNASAIYSSIANYMNDLSRPLQIGNAKYMVDNWAAHKSAASVYGVKQLGTGYEGGASFEPHEFVKTTYGVSNSAVLDLMYEINHGSTASVINTNWWTLLNNNFGTSASAINATNYAMIGVPIANSQPWFDGFFPELAYWASAQNTARTSTPIQNSWNPYMKPI